jgi:hypothetical protein
MRGVARWLTAPLRPFGVVLVPDRHVGPEVIHGRYGLPLLAAILCACVAAFAIGTRLDVGPAVRADNATVTAGKPAEMKTDREIDEEIEQRTAVARVKLGMGALVATPFRILALGMALLLLARFVGGRPTMSRTLTVAALAAVPGAVRSLLTAIAAWHQPRVLPDDVDRLLQFPQVIPDGHPVLARLLTGVDVFTWWSIAIIAFGFGTAGELSRRKSIITVAAGVVLYLVVTRLIFSPGGGAR